MRYVLIAILVLTTITLTSCNKCDASNSTSGLIVDNAIVRVQGNQGGSTNFITSQNQINYSIEMSLDGGITYTAVDWNKYCVFSLQSSASCSTGYHRDVTANPVAKTVTYTVELNECDTCETIVTIKNWVLTTKVPSNYTPKFVLK